MGSNWVYNPYAMDLDYADAQEAIRHNGSYWVQQEIERNGEIESRTPYVPTDWGKDTPADYRELMGGFDEQNGTCDTCYQIKAANGTCGC